MNKLLSIIVLSVLFLGVNCQAENTDVSDLIEVVVPKEEDLP